MPQYATQGSAGLDLYACLDEELIMQPGERNLISTGIAIHIGDSNIVGLIFARSGLAVKKGLSLVNGVGVLDSDYTNEIKVGLVNHSREAQRVLPGDRVAQLVLMPIIQANWIEVEQLEITERKGGFGSTGS